MKNETYTGLSEALQALKTRYVQLPEEGIDQQTPEPLACLIRACEAVLQEEQIRRDRQLREVRKARRDGIIGRPVTPCREDFLKLTYLHDKKNGDSNGSDENGYRSCHFMQNEKEISGGRGMEDIRKLIVFLIINISAFLCYLLGKENRRKIEDGHEEE